MLEKLVTTIYGNFLNRVTVLTKNCYYVILSSLIMIT